MSSHCAVIGSDVGGITNIIIDGFNGIMIPAGDSIRLYEAMRFLIDNPEKRKQIAQKGYDSIAHSFSLDVWRSKWGRIVDEYITQKGIK